MVRKKIALVAVAFLLMTIGCRVQVEKDKEGNDKNVKIDTPVGKLRVNSDDTSAADVGLPVYPGAALVKGGDNKSADVRFGFGDWQFRVKAVSYETSDSSDKVMAYYKKALGRYGDVIQCKGDEPVGEPTHTREGLTCNEDHAKSNAHVTKDMTMSLEAGSRHHQHIFGIDKETGSGTRFALVELQLPSGPDDDSNDN
ncbi:hypothetical protein [Silvibacterium acidisoli]|uniref:hypothetical protein n=1 Tax=Acidobacteriaceae bacterium ZG23-2 TaxID=2883246 RepID=UPI00406D330D